MDSTYKTYHDTDTYENYATGLLNKILVSFFNCLSLLGTFLIIASYIKWKDIRTTSRKVLVFLSISDFLVSAGYLVGNFLPKKTKENENACIAQSFITSSASIISFMWSASLAIYLHFTLVQNRRSFANKLVSVFHVTNWLTGPTINIIATDQKVLGSSADDVTAGWCWILHYSDPEKRYKEILWMLFDGKFWEILTAALIVVFYISVKLKIRKEVRIFSHTI